MKRSLLVAGLVSLLTVSTSCTNIYNNFLPSSRQEAVEVQNLSEFESFVSSKQADEAMEFGSSLLYHDSSLKVIKTPLFGIPLITGGSGRFIVRNPDGAIFAGYRDSKEKGEYTAAFSVNDKNTEVMVATPVQIVRYSSSTNGIVKELSGNEQVEFRTSGQASPETFRRYLSIADSLRKSYPIK